MAVGASVALPVYDGKGAQLGSARTCL